MRRAALMRSAVQDVLARVSPDSVRITRVVLELGAIDHLTEDVARQHFAANARNTPAEDASLEIGWLPATYHCASCLCAFTSDQPPEAVICPVCGDIFPDVDQLAAFRIRHIEVDNGAPMRSSASRQRAEASQGSRPSAGPSLAGRQRHDQRECRAVSLH